MLVAFLKLPTAFLFRYAVCFNFEKKFGWFRGRISHCYCYVMKIREEDEEIEADGANYQLEMMRCLREVNVDNNTVGWSVS